MFDAGADFQIQDPAPQMTLDREVCTPLHMAIRRNDLRMMSLMLDMSRPWGDD